MTGLHILGLIIFILLAYAIKKHYKCKSADHNYDYCLGIDKNCEKCDKYYLKYHEI